MVWGDFSGDKGKGGLYFFPKNVTTYERGQLYLRVLDHHMLPFWDIHRCNHFMQDDDPVHRSMVVKKWLKDSHVPVLECPRNSPNLNPIENSWNYMRNKVQEAHSTNIQTLVLMKLWVPIYICRIFSEVRRIQAKCYKSQRSHHKILVFVFSSTYKNSKKCTFYSAKILNVNLT